ncbi:MAG: translation initiation factor IF-2 N-terminal domain-containing protein, partial [Actinomycetota bacterium]|nr:translation initiation factor IF-2 N-terminal domain-containing protein [Actinomycetota bacterium]
MNKRVHEIAKERGLTAKDVLAQLNAAGINVKASSSSVDEDVAKRVLVEADPSTEHRTAAPDASAGSTATAGRARNTG